MSEVTPGTGVAPESTELSTSCELPGPIPGSGLHALHRLVVLPAFEARHHGDVVGDGQVREESHFLNDVAHGSSQAHHIPFTRVSALDAHRTRLRQEQSIDELEDRGLAGAAGPDERERFSFLDCQRESVENGSLAGVGPRHVIEFDAAHSFTIWRVDE